MDEERTRRVGMNEALFREVNEKVRDVSESFGVFSGTLTLVCECGDASCIEQVELRPEEYTAVREDAALFVIKPGHEAADVEEVVAHRGGYDVVKKHPSLPTEIAKATEPSG